MFPNQFTSLLDEGGITPGNIPRLATLLEEWYAASPSVTPFVLRAIFRELADEWDDPQGVPTERYLPFQSVLLPQLRRLATLLVSGNYEPLPAALDETVRVFHACCAAVRRS